MPDIQLGSHTIQSHGVHLARFHMHDWIILLLLVVIEIVLNVIEPFYRFVGEDMMTDLKYPLKSNTVPVWSIIAVLLPFAVFPVYYFYKRDVYDLRHAILGLLFSVLITGVLTDAIKDAVGRPRPDFFWRCFPNGTDLYDPVTKNVACTGEKGVIKEGHNSFPSGHTSLFDRRGHVAKLCLVFLPLLVAALVGVSRVDDYWHHWQDVFAGTTVASFCYLQFFPPPYHVDGWGPHVYFQMLAERGSVAEVSSLTANGLSIHPSEMESVSMQSGRGGRPTSTHMTQWKVGEVEFVKCKLAT
ncbi:hypothetical protein AQUCO_00300058v1 [Aquilegia coerulea]|uniref:Phosphatidic acid phosphatase type 2/haloperoxidase domain-containing protein n=1 Tax=Aquilegia coerulea TaxID=218851 RepID=A0A2G5EX35_AQUCA|nr:hypothetical protein AQUCO_00300058v1 [Aquilegia coerulea]